VTKGIEVGHIFQLGTTYSEALGATFLDRDGKAKPFVMGTYGIGVSRLVAVMIEQHHDEKGCLWTEATTPFKFDIVISSIKDETQVNFATSLYEEMKEVGLSVLLDDRNERFGFKMGDFELLGFPYAIIVGKGLKDGEVQLVNRKTLEKETISKDKIFDIVKGL
jgi:prolyl-tRNA synthetase